MREYRASSSVDPWTLVSTTGPELPAGNQESFTVTNDGTWYEYTVTATNIAGQSPESPKSAAVQGAAPPRRARRPQRRRSRFWIRRGLQPDHPRRLHYSAAQLGDVTSVQYGINAQTASGSWTSPGRPGSAADESISGLVNGTNYVVYVRGCNDAGLCGPWAGPSNQVTPYTTPAAPSVSAQANGTSITYTTWSGGGMGGRAVDHYHVCFDGGSCEDTGAGSTTMSYGYSQTHSVTAYVVDAAGQQSATGSASAQTVAAPSMSISLSEGPAHSVSGCACMLPCHAVDVLYLTPRPTP